MSPHARRTGRARAALALAVLAVVAAGLSVRGTFAAWTDNATMPTGSFSSGTLDLTLNGNLVGVGGSWQNTSLGLGNLSPGESTAVAVSVRNNGSTPLKYGISAVGAGTLAVTDGLRFAVYPGVTATTTGTEAAANRTGSCGGTSPGDAATTPVATTATFGSDRTLAAGASESVCIVARLSSAAPNSLQGQSGTTATFTFNARQLTAP